MSETATRELTAVERYRLEKPARHLTLADYEIGCVLRWLESDGFTTLAEEARSLFDTALAFRQKVESIALDGATLPVSEGDSERGGDDA